MRSVTSLSSPFSCRDHAVTCWEVRTRSFYLYCSYCFFFHSAFQFFIVMIFKWLDSIILLHLKNRSALLPIVSTSPYIQWKEYYPYHSVLIVYPSGPFGKFSSHWILSPGTVRFHLCSPTILPISRYDIGIHPVTVLRCITYFSSSAQFHEP